MYHDSKENSLLSENLDWKQNCGGAPRRGDEKSAETTFIGKLQAAAYRTGWLMLVRTYGRTCIPGGVHRRKFRPSFRSRAPTFPSTLFSSQSRRRCSLSRGKDRGIRIGESRDHSARDIRRTFSPGETTCKNFREIHTSVYSHVRVRLRVRASLVKVRLSIPDDC